MTRCPSLSSITSMMLMSPIIRASVAALERFVAAHQIPLVGFHKGQRKDDVMAQHLRDFRFEEGVGAGEDAGVPHREAEEPTDRRPLSLDRQVDRDG